ncbi:MAG: ATPase [Myxococcales bacterium]|nr:ATPase [Myxococcales bacterium]
MHDELQKRAMDKLQRLRKELSEQFIEREAVIDGALAALLAGEHVLLLGPVGTAKSMLAMELCGHLSGSRYFGWLLTKFTTPEEIFGAISLKALEADRYQRITTAKLPEADIAFLDEIFKANSAILNSLLSLINERVYHNGTEAQPVPLKALFAASNELPEEGELMALFDRFMLRYTIGYIEEDFRFLKMLSLPEGPSERDVTHLGADELKALQGLVGAVPIHDGYLGDLVELRRRLRKKGVVASDRRYRKALRVLKAFALVDGRREVTQRDLNQLQHILWSEPEQRGEVLETLREVFHGHVERAQGLLFQAREVRDYALRGWDDAETSMRASIEAHTKLKRIHNAVQEVLRDARERRREISEVQGFLTEIEAIQKKILMEVN